MDPACFAATASGLTMARVRSMASDYSKRPRLKSSAVEDDPDAHKGALEGDRPQDEQMGNPHGSGVDDEGLPDDPIATAEDRIGANEDESQG